MNGAVGAQCSQWGEFQSQNKGALPALGIFAAWRHQMLDAVSWAVELLLWQPLHEFPDYCVFF